MEKRSKTTDINAYMNIHHFEELMYTFQSHENEDGFDIDTFRRVFGEILGGALSYDQMTQLFMKIDANSDGCLSWDEFSTYMMMGAIGGVDETSDVFDERVRRLLGSPHRDMIRRVDFVARERKYVTVARDGTVCFWSPTLRLQRTVATKELYNQFEAGVGSKNGTSYWIMDAVFLHDHGKLVVITDHRQLCIYDVLAIKPRALAIIGPLEDNPLCVSYHPRYDEERDLMLFGDDRGYVNVLSLTRKFFIDASSDGRPNILEPSKLCRKDSLETNHISLSRRKVHNEWVQKVCFLAEMNAFISCATENMKSLVIGDMDRKAERYIRAPKGINCFEYCRRPSFLVTGGRDKIIRLWNPYVLSKPAGTLHGHNASVTQILINQDESHIISLSEDKVIKVWNARNMTCLQTLTDKVPHRPENVISTLYFDTQNRRLLCGSNKLETYTLFRSNRNQVTRTHDGSVVAALFNENFHQVVSGCQNGTVTLWNAGTGEKIFQFHNLHDGNEITAMCFDKSGRRLVTGSRDGNIKMWNFNNGQLLKTMIKDNPVEVTDIMYIEMGANRFIVAVGWDEVVSVFMDDPEEDEATPCRVLMGEGIHKGHTDDITSIAFSEPNFLATSGVDGAIVLWNLESGHCKGQMQEPYCHLRNPEEKAIEKLAFLNNLGPGVLNTRQTRIPLVSTHADGILRIWDVHEARMVFELDCEMSEGEGLTALAANTDSSMLLIAGSKGHVQMWDVSRLRIDDGTTTVEIAQNLVLVKTWRAHVETINSINFVGMYNVIITASRDHTVRVWSTNGFHIGIFGQADPWVLDDPCTYMPAPSDLKHESLHEQQRRSLARLHAEKMKEAVISAWRATTPRTSNSKSEQEQDGDQGDSQQNSELESLQTKGGYTITPQDLEEARKLRLKAIEERVFNKWRGFVAMRHSARNFTIDSELVQKTSGRHQYFTFRNSTTRPSTSLSPPRPKSEAVWRSVAWFPLDEQGKEPRSTN